MTPAATTALPARPDADLRALGDEADRRRDELDHGRRVPSDLYRRTAQAGLFRQLIPMEMGGLGRRPLEWFRTGIDVARHEASYGWIVTQGSASMAWIAAGGDPGWAKEVLRDPLAAQASSVAGVGTLEPDGDGFLLQGSWSFASGCQDATWVGGLAMVSGDGHAPDLRFALVPSDRARIDETWDPIGMRGTGSHTVVIDRQRVPATWTFSTFLPSPHATGPLAVMVGNGNWPIATAVAATQLGNARRALDEVTALLPTKRPAPDFAPLAGKGSVQQALMEAEGLWIAAKAGVEVALERMWDAACEHGHIPTDVRAQLLVANVTASRVSVDVVTRSCDLAGTSMVPADHVLARCLRDVHVLRGHISVNADALERAGRMHLGLVDDDVLV